VPADIFGCFATNVANGAARIEALLKLVALINDSKADGAGEAQARDQLARVEDRLGGDLGEILENISTVAVAMMPPDVTRLAREASGDATTRPAGRGPVVPPTFEQMVRSSLLCIVQVKDVAAFNKLLERLAREIPFASTQPVKVERRKATDGERRIYWVNQQVRLHLARVEQTYILSLRPELVEAAVAAHAGQIPDLTLGLFSRPALDDVPAEASKLLMLRPDFLVNTINAVQNLQRGFRPGRVVYSPVASMKPTVMYTIEGDTKFELATRVYDLPILLRTLLKIVPGPPPSPAR